MPEMQINDEVIMVINRVALLRNGKYGPFSALDQIELKAGLMNFRFLATC
jgi:hypothetical protein